MTTQRVNVGIALCLILLAVILRLLPHPANFAPITAVAIFGGALLPRRYSVVIPLAAMIATDMVIGLHDLVLVTWGSYALVALASSVWLAKKVTFLRTAWLMLGGATFFFLTTNFAVWAVSDMYAHTWAGLVKCYTLAIPFFRTSLLSDLFYVSALFGVYSLALYASRSLVTNKSVQV